MVLWIKTLTSIDKTTKPWPNLQQSKRRNKLRSSDKLHRYFKFIEKSNNWLSSSLKNDQKNQLKVEKNLKIWDSPSDRIEKEIIRIDLCFIKCYTHTHTHTHIHIPF